jgi:Caspase domain
VNQLRNSDVSCYIAALLWLLPITIPLQAQQTALPGNQRKMALTIGNAAYKVLPPTASAAQDARVVGSALESIGFTVLSKDSLDHVVLKSTIERDFLPSLQAGDLVVFYFSGYGMQIDGDDYLLPVGYDPRSKDDVVGRAYSISRLTALLQSKKVKFTVIILDACRALPIADSHASHQGLAALNVGPGTLFALSSMPDRVVSGSKVSPSLYAQSIASVIKTPGLLPEQIFQTISNKVRDDSAGAQVPLAISNVKEEIYLVPRVVVTESKPPVAAAHEAAAAPPPLLTHAELYYYLSPSDKNPAGLEVVPVKLRVTLKAFGAGGAASSYDAEGKRSPIRVKGGRPPEFLVHRGADGGTISPQAFGWLYAMDNKSRGRRLYVEIAGPAGAKSKWATAIPVEVSKYSVELVKVVPTAPLPPGEYAFVAPGDWLHPYANGPTWDKTAQLFCFGVDPN